MDLSTRRRALMAKIIALVKMVVTSATGLVSFVTDIVRPVKVTCEFSPVQEGAGDPSPDNVRPISGWTGCEISHTGKNMMLSDDPAKPDANYNHNSTGRVQYSEEYGAYCHVGNGVAYGNQAGLAARSAAFVATQPVSVTYSVKIYNESADYPIRTAFTGRATVSHRVNKEQWTTITVSGQMQAGDKFTTQFAGGCYWKDQQIEIGTVATEYEPYQAITLPITFTDPSTSDPLTVYGGTVTLNEDGSADLVSEWRKITYLADGTNWSVVGYGGSGESRWFNMYIRATEHPCSAITPTNGDDNGLFNLGVWRYGAISGRYRAYAYTESEFRCVLTGIDRDVSTKEQMIAFLSTLPAEPEIVYRIKNPIRYHFDNIGQLNSFLGTNNVWHDMNGGITVEYWNKQ